MVPEIDTSIPSPFIADTRRNDDGDREILLYKLDFDSFGRPFYKPAGLQPLTEYEAACIVTAFGSLLGVVQ